MFIKNHAGIMCCLMFCDPQGAEIVQRIHQKKELGCKAATYHTIEEGKSSAKESAFWEILGGRKLSHSELASQLLLL